MTTLQRPGPSAPADGPHGVDRLNRPALNKGTAFTEDERGRLGLHGLLPPHVETLDEQVVRAYEAYRRKDGDVVVRGKMTLDAFHSTPLNYLLRANEIETVAFAGFHTNWCVESSARSAYDLGYRVIVIRDCTATDTDREQEYAEQVIFPRIGKVVTAAEFLDALAL